MSETLTAGPLQEMLHYDPETGVFTWKVSTSNRVRVGSIAGTLNTQGYITIQINNKAYYAHRLAWYFSHGEWPTDQIDHANGVRSDNALANLRACSGAENSQNLGTRKTRTKGLLGTTWLPDRGLWLSQISARGRKLYLGLFPTPEEAHEAYLKAKRELHTFQPVPRTTTTGATHAD